MPDTVDIPPPPPPRHNDLNFEPVATVINPDYRSAPLTEPDLDFNAIDTALDALPPAPNESPPTKETKTSNIAARQARQTARNETYATNQLRIDNATKYLNQSPILTIIRNSPCHPLTGEFIRRHMQSFDSKYENPPKAPTTTRAWLLHIGTNLPKQEPQVLTATSIIYYINALCRHLDFACIPNIDPKEKPYDATHILFNDLDTRPCLKYKLTTLPTTHDFGYRTPNQIKFSTPLNTKPIRISGSLDHAQGLAVLKPNFSRLLQGLDTSTYNLRRIEQNKAPYLHCLAYLSTHLLKFHLCCDTDELFFARLADLRSTATYNPPPTDEASMLISKLAYCANLPQIPQDIFDAEPIDIYNDILQGAFHPNRFTVTTSTLTDILNPPPVTIDEDEDEDENLDDDDNDDAF
jgi:hypothetical protein